MDNTYFLCFVTISSGSAFSDVLTLALNFCLFFNRLELLTEYEVMKNWLWWPLKDLLLGSRLC